MGVWRIVVSAVQNPGGSRATIAPPRDAKMSESVNVGVIGCGAISAQYFKMAAKLPILRMAACADLDRERAEARAAEFGVPRVLSVEELLADPEIEVVLNLTVPKAHAALGDLLKERHLFGDAISHYRKAIEHYVPISGPNAMGRSALVKSKGLAGCRLSPDMTNGRVGRTHPSIDPNG